jgi:hypothetical protein
MVMCSVSRVAGSVMRCCLCGRFIISSLANLEIDRDRYLFAPDGSMICMVSASTRPTTLTISSWAR